MIEAALEWVRAHPVLLGWLALASAVMFFGTILAVPFVVVRIPADRFTRAGLRRRASDRFSPPVRIALRIAKNLLGALLVLAGVAMLLLPGQGVLTILLGVLLLDLPGKRRLELWLVRRPAVSRAMNWMRARAGVEPLRVEGGLAGREPADR